MRRQEFDASFEGSRISTRRSYKDGLYIWDARKFSEHVATLRSVFLSFTPLRFLGCIFLHQHIHWRPHVTTHRSHIAKFLPLLLPLPRYHLAPHPPDVLFYFIIRPDLGELGWLPRRIYRETSLLLSLPLFLFYPLFLSLIFSATAARFSTNGETGISASNTRIFCCCCSLYFLPLLPSPPSPSSFTISLSWFRYVSSSRGSLLCHFIIRFTDAIDTSPSTRSHIKIMHGIPEIGIAESNSNLHDLLLWLFSINVKKKNRIICPEKLSFCNWIVC